MLSETEAAWLSGFIDGEGHVGLHPQRQSTRTYYQAVVYIRHTHMPTVEWVRDLVARLAIDVNIVPMAAESVRHKNSFRLYITGMDRILRLADAVEPYSVTKIEQWAIVREYCELRLASAGSRSGYTDRELELAEAGGMMNRRGPVAGL